MSYDSWKTTEPDFSPAPERCADCGGDIDEKEGCSCRGEPDCPACLHPDSECTCESHRADADDNFDGDGDEQL